MSTSATSGRGGSSLPCTPEVSRGHVTCSSWKSAQKGYVPLWVEVPKRQHLLPRPPHPLRTAAPRTACPPRRVPVMVQEGELQLSRCLPLSVSLSLSHEPLRLGECCSRSSAYMVLSHTECKWSEHCGFLLNFLCLFYFAFHVLLLQ